MQDLSSIVAEYDQDKQHPECRSRYREGVGGDDVLGVIFQERTPRLRRRFSASDHVLGHDRLGHVYAKLQLLTVNPRRSPQWVGPAHAPN